MLADTDPSCPSAYRGSVRRDGGFASRGGAGVVGAAAAQSGNRSTERGARRWRGTPASPAFWSSTPAEGASHEEAHRCAASQSRCRAGGPAACRGRRREDRLRHMLWLPDGWSWGTFGAASSWRTPTGPTRSRWPGGDWGANPAWSPDGSKIAFGEGDHLRAEPRRRNPHQPQQHPAATGAPRGPGMARRSPSRAIATGTLNST